MPGPWATGSLHPEEYAPITRLFGDIVPAGTDYTARFGHEGKVFYVPGPSESGGYPPAHTIRAIALRSEAVGSIYGFEDDQPNDFDDGYDLEGEIVPDGDGNDDRAIA